MTTSKPVSTVATWLSANQAKLWLGVTYAGIGLVALLAVHSCDARADENATLRAQILTLTTQQKTLAHTVDTLNVTVKHDSLIYVTRWQTQYKAIHDTVLMHQTDTVTVERFVQVADSTIGACNRTLAACYARGVALGRKAVLSDSIAAAWKKQAPGFWQRHVGPITVGALVGGFLLGRLR